MRLQVKLRHFKMKNPKEVAFAIICNGEYVGNIGVHKIDYDNKKTEIGYWVRQQYWGNGIASEAVKQVIIYSFKRFKLKRISAVAYSYNKSSQRVLEKAGMKYEGTMKKSTKKFGKFLDEKIYAIVK